MRSDENQLDWTRRGPAAMAHAYRVAADRALLNQYESETAREEQAAHYRSEAERIEREARG